MGAGKWRAEYNEYFKGKKIATELVRFTQKFFEKEGIEVEVSQIGKECHTRCAIFYQAGDCVMPKEGIFVKVLKGGMVKVGDRITVAGQHLTVAGLSGPAF